MTAVGCGVFSECDLLPVGCPWTSVVDTVLVPPQHYHVEPSLGLRDDHLLPVQIQAQYEKAIVAQESNLAYRAIPLSPA